MKKQDVSVGTRKNAWLLSNRPAIRHADRFANTGCLLSSEGDDVVAAFAVYVRVNISLPACGHASAFNLHVRAWLIASRKKIPDHESDPESDFFMLWNGRGKQRPDPENSSACHPKEEMLIKRAQPCPNAYILCRHESSCCRRQFSQQFSERSRARLY